MQGPGSESPATEFEGAKAVHRAADLLRRHDYLLAARSCITSLDKDVRNPAALRVDWMYQEYSRR